MQAHPRQGLQAVGGLPQLINSPVDAIQRHGLARVGQRHTRVGEQGVVAVVDNARLPGPGKVVFAQHHHRTDGRHLTVGQGPQHAVEIRLVQARVQAGINHAGGREQAHGPAGRVIGE